MLCALNLLHVIVKSGENQGLLYKIQYHSNWMVMIRKGRIVKSYLLHFTQPVVIRMQLISIKCMINHSIVVQNINSIFGTYT